MSRFSVSNDNSYAQLDTHLATHQFLSESGEPNADDFAIHGQISKLNDRKFLQYSNVFGWYGYINMLNKDYLQLLATQQAEQQQQQDKPKQDKKGGKKGGKQEEKQEEKKAEEEFDLFGDAPVQTEEEKLQAQKEKAEKAKPPKKKAVAQTQFVFEVKVDEYDVEHPEAAEQVLRDLSQRIFTEINMEGLKWNPNANLVAVAYGVKKLVLSCIIDDDKVASTEDITGPIEGWEGVQSVDTLSMQKM